MERGSLKRRDFLKLTGLSTAAWAGGAAFHWPDSRPELTDAQGPSGHQILIPTREHYGDVDERLQMLPDWQVKVYYMAGHNAPVLTQAEIRRRIQSPIGTRTLAEIAEGKSSAVITFDDLTRPTPTYAVMPLVIEELKKAGIGDDRIILLTSYGSHRPLEQDEAIRKLGAEIANNYIWLNHNIWENLADIGKTSRGNRIKVNRHFMQADVKVCISGIKVHGTAGYGGGAKAILPGIASAESIDYFHRTIAGVGGNRNKTVGAAKIYQNECRLDMEEAARLAQVDFTVQIVYNGKRQVVGIFAGDVVEAFRAACQMANQHYRTEVAKNADIVIVNAYPQNTQGWTSLGWMRSTLRDGGSGVLILQNPQGFSTWHYMEERWTYNPKPYWEERHIKGAYVPQASQLIVYSQYLQMRDKAQFDKRVIFAGTWAEVLEHLRRAHPRDATVAVYPYAAIQHGPIDLDLPRAG